MTAVLVLAGGAFGALSRYLTERWAVRRFHERIPVGTAIANLVGAFVLGLLAGLDDRGAIDHAWVVFLGTGYCGALTTFSGFMGQVESRLRHRSTRGVAIGYLVGTVVLGLALASAGYALAT